MMESQILPEDEVTPAYLFELMRRHRLVLHNMELTVDRCRQISGKSAVLMITDSDKDVARAVVCPGYTDGLTLDVVPIPSMVSTPKLRNEAGMHISDFINKALNSGDYRYVTSYVPETRFRTVKILTSAGFVKRGYLEDGVRLAGKEPEGLVILQFLGSRMNGERNGTI